jgi:ketosteroid isomerase-like protein
VRAEEFIPGERASVVGVYWIGDDGGRREPLVFHVVEMRDGQIAHIQDYAKRAAALSAAGAA